ncbi:hypothetical protein R6Q59_003841 [Mikania micrantha]
MQTRQYDCSLAAGGERQQISGGSATSKRVDRDTGNATKDPEYQPLPASSHLDELTAPTTAITVGYQQEVRQRLSIEPATSQGIKRLEIQQRTRNTSHHRLFVLLQRRR